MAISRARALVIGVTAISGVVLLHAVNSFACHGHDFSTFLESGLLFVGAPLVPALVSLALPDPLRAVGACALLAPWLLLAYYTDCVRPYTGGGASMIYVAVLLLGTPSSLIGALIAGPIMRRMRLESPRR